MKSSLFRISYLLERQESGHKSHLLPAVVLELTDTFHYNLHMHASPVTRLPDCLPDAIRRLTQELNPRQIILFGSWARGDARPDSDIDLLIVMPEVDNKRETAIQAMRALRDLPVSKDVIVTTPQEIQARGDEIGLVLRPALREGVVVYERK